MTTIDFEEDADKLAITPEQLNEISELAKKQIALMQDVAAKEEALKKAKAELFKMETDTLPSALKAAGCTGYTLANGGSITVEDKLYMSIPKKNLEEAIKWLIKAGQQSLVKRDVTLPFNKGDEESLARAVFLLERSGFKDKFSVAQTVNTTSVKAVVKELLEKGQDVPMSLLGAYQQSVAVITLPEVTS